MWNAWANGNFTEADEILATRWREQAAMIDLDGITAEWKPFCDEHLRNARSIQDVIDGVDALIERREEQRNLLGMVYHFLEAPPAAQLLSSLLFATGSLTVTSPENHHFERSPAYSACHKTPTAKS